MFPYESHRDLSREHEARVAKAVRQHQLLAALPRKPSRFAAALERLEAWLTTAHIYPARYEVAEDGYLA